MTRNRGLRHGHGCAGAGHLDTWTRLVITHLVVHDVEGVGPGPRLGLHVDAVVLVDGALAEDDAVEGSVEADLHLHVGLPAHHLHNIWLVTNKNI